MTFGTSVRRNLRMTLEKFWAGISLGLLLWGLGPLAFYFYLGMGDRTDKTKKIYASIVLALGIFTLTTAIYGLISENSKEHDFSFVYALIGLLCFLQSGFIFYRIRMHNIEDRIDSVERAYKEQIDRLAESCQEILKKCYDNERDVWRETHVRNFYRAYLDEEILNSPKNYSKSSSRIIKSIGWSNGVIVSKTHNFKFYELIDDLFLKIPFLSNFSESERQEKENLCKGIIDYFVKNIEYNDVERRRAWNKFFNHLNLYEKDSLVGNVAEEDAFVFTEKYYLRSVDRTDEKYHNKSVLNTNFIFHSEVYSKSYKVIYDLYGFDYVNPTISKNDPEEADDIYSESGEVLYNRETDSTSPILRELFIIPSTESDFYFIRKDVDGDYSFFQIGSDSFSDQEIDNLWRKINDLRYDLCPYKFPDPYSFLVDS